MSIKSVEEWAIIISVAVSILVSGCTNNQSTSNPDTSNTVVTSEDNKDQGNDVTGAADVTGTGDKATQEPEVTTAPEEKTYDEIIDNGEPKMDYIAMLEYDRSRQMEKKDYYETLDNSCPQTWCFQRKKDHTQSGTYENFHINDYNAEYVDQTVTDDDKVMYLTFDCGYPSDLTVKILDTLKKHNAVGNFFVTKMYLEDCGDYAKRMKEEGHLVCNHTVTHSDLVKKDVKGVLDEIYDVAEYFYEITGYEMDPFLRTPTGSYSKRLLTIIEDAGYMTVFWSIAYGDYDPKNQPAAGYVTDHFKTYHHNGCIALMHNDSPSNANELDAVLTYLEGQGYRFAPLTELKIKE